MSLAGSNLTRDVVQMVAKLREMRQAKAAEIIELSLDKMLSYYGILGRTCARSVPITQWSD